MAPERRLIEEDGSEMREAAAVDATRGQKRAPDFFIVGHQKCGTTALYLMLSRHPQIYMPELKEPMFFAPELRSRFGPGREPRRPHTLDGYLSLFAAANADQRIGEATPDYIRSNVAASRIASVQADARIIVILREPASFLRSFHLQMLQNKNENQKDLGKAIALEGVRRQGRRIPRRCISPPALLYSEHVRYVEQLRRFHAAFPPEQVLVLIYDDFRRDNEATLRTVQRFLEVDDAYPIEKVETKPLKTVRFPSLHNVAADLRFARRNRAAAGPVSRTLNALVPGPLRRDTFRAKWRRIVYAAPPPPDEDLMLELRRRFKPEVVALSEYLGRDLVALWGYDNLE